MANRIAITNSLFLTTDSIVMLPTAAYHDREVAKQLKNEASAAKLRFHIYMLGARPRVTITDIRNHFDEDQWWTTWVTFCNALGVEETFATSATALERGEEGKRYEIRYDGLALGEQGGGEDAYTWAALALEQVARAVDRERRATLYADFLDFKVLYVGQSLGTGGGLDAVSRINGHEKLAELSGMMNFSLPDTSTLWAAVATISAGQLPGFETRPADLSSISDSHLITCAEAGLINLFNAPLNTEYKGTFPDAAHTSYSQVYEAFDAVTINVLATFGHQEVPYRFWSDTLQPNLIHQRTFDFNKSKKKKGEAQEEGTEGPKRVAGVYLLN